MPKRKLRLGINVDHVATLRQARRETFPSPVEAAEEALRGGADGMVCHLREDRRHIQEEDVWGLKRLGCRLDLEMALTPWMVDFALRLKPNMVTLVPEKREEVTTEGGLDIEFSMTPPEADKCQMMEKIQKLQDKNIIVSLFIDPEEGQIRAAAESGAAYIELHTGAYADQKTKKLKNERTRELQKIKKMAALAVALGLKVNAGHGLDYNNVCAIAAVPQIEELNIGFSVIARAMFVGMRKATQEMRLAMEKGRKR